jgi:hypothetical protein
LSCNLLSLPRFCFPRGITMKHPPLLYFLPLFSPAPLYCMNSCEVTKPIIPADGNKLTCLLFVHYVHFKEEPLKACARARAHTHTHTHTHTHSVHLKNGLLQHLAL